MSLAVAIGVGAALWVVVALAVALVLGNLLRRRDQQRPHDPEASCHPHPSVSDRSPSAAAARREGDKPARR